MIIFMRGVWGIVGLQDVSTWRVGDSRKMNGEFEIWQCGDGEMGGKEKGI